MNAPIGTAVIRLDQNGAVFQPEEAFSSTFSGINPLGIWTVEIRDIDITEDNGLFQQWYKKMKIKMRKIYFFLLFG
ncbi:MAG: hypothetical protein ACPGED_11810 [Flavobacteriales bacterium]